MAKALKNLEEIARVPLEQPIVIDLTPDPPKSVDIKPQDGTGENNEPIEQIKANDKLIPYDVTPRDADVEKPRRGRPPKKDVEADDSSAKLLEFQNKIKEMEANERRYQDELAAARAEAIRLAKDKEDSVKETAKFRDAAETAEFDSVLNALGASQAEAEAAQVAYEQAVEAADVKGMANAQRRISRAESQIVSLEAAKATLEQRQEERKNAKPVEQRPANEYEQALARLPIKAQNWIKDHPEYFNDPAKNRRIQAIHSYITDVEGIQEFSDRYYNELETRLGLKQRAVESDDDDGEDELNERQAALSSAPVVREGTSPSGSRDTPTRITLTPEQRQAAKVSGISEVEYAQNLLKLRQAKRDGHYQERG